MGAPSSRSVIAVLVAVPLFSYVPALRCQNGTAFNLRPALRAWRSCLKSLSSRRLRGDCDSWHNRCLNCPARRSPPAIVATQFRGRDKTAKPIFEQLRRLGDCQRACGPQLEPDDQTKEEWAW